MRRRDRFHVFRVRQDVEVRIAGHLGEGHEGIGQLIDDGIPCPGGQAGDQSND